MITNELGRVKKIISNVINEIKTAPEKELIIELIKACKTLDEYYKEWCEEQDSDTGDSKGTCYRKGTFMEFYIESCAWHNISLQLRKLNI